MNTAPEWLTWLRNAVSRVRNLKREIAVLYYVFLDEETPYYVKVLAVMVVAYSLSPIDLIPDFIPVIGYLDDIIIVPLGVWLCLKLVPWYVLKDAREKAAKNPNIDRTFGYMAAVVILIIYVALAVWLWNRFYAMKG